MVAKRSSTKGISRGSKLGPPSRRLGREAAVEVERELFQETPCVAPSSNGGNEQATWVEGWDASLAESRQRGLSSGAGQGSGATSSRTQGARADEERGQATAAPATASISEQRIDKNSTDDVAHDEPPNMSCYPQTSASESSMGQASGQTNVDMQSPGAGPSTLNNVQREVNVAVTIERPGDQSDRACQSISDVQQYTIVPDVPHPPLPVPLGQLPFYPATSNAFAPYPSLNVGVPTGPVPGPSSVPSMSYAHDQTLPLPSYPMQLPPNAGATTAPVSASSSPQLAWCATHNHPSMAAKVAYAAIGSGTIDDPVPWFLTAGQRRDPRKPQVLRRRKLHDISGQSRQWQGHLLYPYRPRRVRHSKGTATTMTFLAPPAPINQNSSVPLPPPTVTTATVLADPDVDMESVPESGAFDMSALIACLNELSDIDDSMSGASEGQGGTVGDFDVVMVDDDAFCYHEKTESLQGLITMYQDIIVRPCTPPTVAPPAVARPQAAPIPESMGSEPTMAQPPEHATDGQVPVKEFSCANSVSAAEEVPEPTRWYTDMEQIEQKRLQEVNRKKEEERYIKRLKELEERDQMLRQRFYDYPMRSESTKAGSTRPPQVRNESPRVVAARIHTRNADCSKEGPTDQSSRGWSHNATRSWADREGRREGQEQAKTSATPSSSRRPPSAAPPRPQPSSGRPSSRRPASPRPQPTSTSKPKSSGSKSAPSASAGTGSRPRAEKSSSQHDDDGKPPMPGGFTDKPSVAGPGLGLGHVLFAVVFTVGWQVARSFLS